MNIFGRKISHPGTALVIYFLIGALLAKYGIVEGSLLLFALFAGVIIYKVVTAME
jgi:hypothetical protein